MLWMQRMFGPVMHAPTSESGAGSASPGAALNWLTCAWRNYLSFLYLSFLICKTGKIAHAWHQNMCGRKDEQKGGWGSGEGLALTSFVRIK